MKISWNSRPMLFLWSWSKIKLRLMKFGSHAWNLLMPFQRYQHAMMKISSYLDLLQWSHNIMRSSPMSWIIFSELRLMKYGSHAWNLLMPFQRYQHAMMKISSYLDLLQWSHNIMRSSPMSWIIFSETLTWIIPIVWHYPSLHHNMHVECQMMSQKSHFKDNISTGQRPAANERKWAKVVHG